MAAGTPLFVIAIHSPRPTPVEQLREMGFCLKGPDGTHIN